jgi:hypothetical protein
MTSIYRVVMSRTTYLTLDVLAEDEDDVRENAFMLAGEQRAEDWHADQDAIDIETITETSKE